MKDEQRLKKAKELVEEVRNKRDAFSKDMILCVYLDNSISSLENSIEEIKWVKKL